MDSIEKRLKALREEQAGSAAAIADVADMTTRAWGYWEVTPPKALTQLATVAAHYGISADYLLCLTDIETPRREQLSAPIRQLLRIARRLSPQRLKDLVLVAQAFADADKDDKDNEGDGGETTGRKPPGAPGDSDQAAAAIKAKNQAGWDAAMNMFQRKHGEDAARDLLDVVLNEFPDLAGLIGPISTGKDQGVNKS